jgi:hypothetical protein
MKNISKKYKRYIKGAALIDILIFSSIAVIVVTAVISAAAANIRLSDKIYDREKAFHIAEAGNEYYRWHLAYAQTDYHDGHSATSSGPYVHQFDDINGNLLGNFSLTITQPATGTSIVKVDSVGSVNTSSTSREVLTTLAIPSLAQYAVVSNDVLRFGAGTVVYGPIQSNNGIRFDGLAHNLITSSVASYVDPDQGGSAQFGVYTHVIPPPGSGEYPDSFVSAEAPPNAVPSRTDVFMVGRQFPVPAFDFTGLTTDLASLETQGQSSSGKYFGPSGAQGYRIVLNTNDTFAIYKVTSLLSPGSYCTNEAGQTNWGSWSINAQTLVGTYPIPSNGVIFVQDNVWVEGQINTARVTIGAARFPANASNYPTIVVNNNLLYTNFNGSDVISLISQGNVLVGEVSQTNLTVDGALVAQNGEVGRQYYDPYYCSPYGDRNSLTLDGMIASDVRYGFAYTDNSGYATRTINYDNNLLYGPPPSFPLASSQYSTIGWDNVK